MNSSHAKILEVLKKSDEPINQYDISEITGYSANGVRARISELNNYFGYNIESVKMKDGTVGYYLPDAENGELSDYPLVVTSRKIRETKIAINRYYKLLSEIREEVKKKKAEVPVLKPRNESLVILNSDFHIGKRVVDENSGAVTFDTSIAVSRVNRLMGKNLEKLINHILSSSKIDEIVILNIGDLIDGEAMYYLQHQHIDKYLGEQIEVATRVKWTLIESLWDRFGIPIREEFVVGNHGKGHADYEGLTNFDSLIHLNLGILRDLVGNKNVVIGGGPNAKTKIVDIRGHRILMRHYAPQQVETASAFRKYAGWLNIYDYDAVVTGHFHSPSITFFQGRPVIRNGSIVGEDEYSRELGRTSNPSQIVFGVSNKRLPTFIYVVDML